MSSLLVPAKPPATGAAPPLPPYLAKREPKPRYLIMPDYFRPGHTKTQHENCFTVHYAWMLRLELETGDMQMAHANSRRYRQWLDTYQTKDGVPPHVEFGGAVISGPADPEFYTRWVEYAKRTFV